MSPGGMGGGGFGGQVAQAAVAAPGPARTAKPPRGRTDPFEPWWEARPAVLSMIAPMRLAPASLGGQPPTEPVEIREPPMGRVAGILTGDGAYALLERPDGVMVVKPGDVVAGYRVDAIRASSVVLRRRDGNRTYTQIVPLTDIPTMGFMAPGAGSGMMAPGGAPMMGGAIPGMPGGLGGGIGAEGEGL